MLQTQGSIRRSLQRVLIVSFGVGLFAATSAFAEFTGFTSVSLGGTYPTAMGYAYQTLDRNTPIGFEAQTWADGSWIAHNILLRASLAYEPLIVRNMSSININTFSGFVGLQIQRGLYQSGLSFFFGIDIGLMYDWMTFTSVTNASANAAISFANQIVPGFDLPIYGRFGIIGQMPIRIIYLNSPLVLFDPSISVRFRL